MGKGLAVVSLAAALACAGCWSETHVLTRARSEPRITRHGTDGMGYGTLVQTRAMFLIFAYMETSTYLTGIAAASGDGRTVLADGTPLVDGVWRVMPPGWGRTSLQLRFCRGEGPNCDDVDFERPDGVSDLGYLSILDPVNRGDMLQISVASGGGRTYVSGSGMLTVHDEQSPLSAQLGIWVAPAFGTVFHCAIEPNGPHCRPAMVGDRMLGHTRTLSVQTIARPGGAMTDVLWEWSMGFDGPVRCEVNVSSPVPQCAVAQMM